MGSCNLPIQMHSFSANQRGVIFLHVYIAIINRVKVSQTKVKK